MIHLVMIMICDLCKQSIATKYQCISITVDHDVQHFAVHYPACALKLLEQYDSLSLTSDVLVTGSKPKDITDDSYDDPFKG